MSTYFKKIFPQNGNHNFTSSFKLLILSEGYTSSEENQFYDDVSDLFDRVLKYPPFSLVKNMPNAFSIYASFEASSNHGYASTVSTASGRTKFESYYDSTAQKLFLNNSLIDNYLNDCKVKEETIEYNVKDGLTKEFFYPSVLNTLVLVLLPSTGGNNNNAEDEVTSNSYYYKIATTKDGFYEQVVIRAIGKLVGLADEFELEGTDWETPSSNDVGNAVDAYYPNIFFLSNPANSPNPTTATDFKWRTFFGAGYNQAIVPVAHPGSTNTPDRSLPAISQFFDEVGLWEGAGGYRTKMYRSAYDCLMRRRIADTTLPIKARRVDLCRVCSSYLVNVFGL